MTRSQKRSFFLLFLTVFAVQISAIEAAETILVGVYGPLTGADASYGQSNLHGVMLAVDEVNKAEGVKGRQIEVKSEDDKSEVGEAGKVATKLITSDQVLALIGDIPSSSSIAGGRVAQQYGTPMITPSSTNVDVTKIGDMIFRVCFLDSFQGYVMAKFVAERTTYKKVALFYDQAAAYSVGLKRIFQKEFEKLGGTIVSDQSYTSGDPDFSAQLGTIASSGAQAIYLPGYYNDVANIAIQARRRGITLPLLGGDGWDSPQLMKIAREAVNGSYFSNHYSPYENTSKVAQTFAESYQRAYGILPDSNAALGYDAANLLFDAMKRAKSMTRKDIAQAISETKDFPGVTGKITIDRERNAQKSAVILQIQNGIPTYITAFDPPTTQSAAPNPLPTPTPQPVPTQQKPK